jgi:hypothetical protein
VTSCLAPGPTGKKTEPFVLIKKRHVFDPSPRMRIGSASSAVSGDLFTLFCFLFQVHPCQRRFAALSFCVFCGRKT